MQWLSSVIARAWAERLKITRFIISGCAAAITNIGTLYILIEFFAIWYLYASVAAVCAALSVSFTLQKFWTFRDNETANIHRQATVYALIVLFNLALNTVFVYYFVEYEKWQPIVAQFVSSLLIAFESYFAYGFLVFRAGHKVVEYEEHPIA